MPINERLIYDDDVIYAYRITLNTLHGASRIQRSRFDAIIVFRVMCTKRNVAVKIKTQRTIGNLNRVLTYYLEIIKYIIYIITLIILWLLLYNTQRISTIDKVAHGHIFLLKGN